MSNFSVSSTRKALIVMSRDSPTLAAISLTVTLILAGTVDGLGTGM
jgi:hypothetical protein